MAVSGGGTATSRAAEAPPRRSDRSGVRRRGPRDRQNHAGRADVSWRDHVRERQGTVEQLVVGRAPMTAPAGALRHGSSGPRRRVGQAHADPTTYVPDPSRYSRMTYRRCGRSGLDLPLLSLGFWWNFGDDRPLETQRAVVRRAFDLGVTHFDLANNYGPPYGAAEVNFGHLLRHDLRPFRDELVISTKAGLGHVAWAVRLGRLAQVPARQPGREPAADGAGPRRHLLLAPAGQLDTARGDDGRAAHRRAVRQGALRRPLLVRRRTHRRGRADPA